MKTKRQKYIFKLSNWLIISFAFSSCAQIVTPGGGPRDVKPPHAIKYIPDSAAINFKAKNIAISFDEFIVLSDLQKQLVISPPMQTLPDIKTKGKMLLIELKDTLKKNTTYTFNFGKSIRDYTEGNAKEDFQYIFSTGTYIDSLQLSGTVKNGFDLKTEKDILMMLYESADDSVPYKKLPFYFAKTNADGTYKINHIRAGTYKVFALKDANANYLYDSPEESIGFSDSLIKIEKNTKLDLTLFKEEPAKQKLKKAYFYEHGHLVFSFTKSTNDSLKLNFLSQEPKENVIYEYSQNKDTLHYWFTDDLKDTLKIQVVEGSKILDTVRLKPITLEQAKNTKRGAKWGLNVKANVGGDKVFDLGKEFSMQFSHPIKTYDSKYIELKRNKTIYSNAHCSEHSKLLSHEWEVESHFKEVNRNLSMAELWACDDSTTGEMTSVTSPLLFTPNDTGSFSLFIPPATFTDIFGLTNDSIKVDFKTQDEKFYGTLKLNLKIKKLDMPAVKQGSEMILQLLDENDKLIQEDFISEEQIINYSYLYPGKCKLKIIYDPNGDGKWTTGNHLKKQQPEKIIYYSGDITIRSNWDLELEWTPSP
ncbi:MAG: Ig-like domain-containing protein [Bacteroidetes bacterium]|nr:Ig-like domain-containing protein [Bacteroidota bacterium]